MPNWSESSGLQSSILLVLVIASFDSAVHRATRAVATEQHEFSLTQEKDAITVNLDGKLFTRYLIRSGSRPVLWPVIGPTEQAMTRGYPVGEGQLDEAHDHIHHRSVWIGYEGVNGFDFWQEKEPGVQRAFPAGEVRHREFVAADCPGETATIVTANDWRAPDGHKVCEDVRTWTFGTDGDQRWMDCRFVLSASEGELRLADSKEGFFALRVAHSLRVDNNQGGKIVTSRGLTDADAWGQPAEWVDYSGPIGDEIVGIAILSHPETLNFPAAWHVRTYGLFAANPLAKIAFTSNAGDVRKRPLRMTLAPGESITLHYRIVLHRGDAEDANIEAKQAAYAAE